jgi:hypothetical protein
VACRLLPGGGPHSSHDRARARPGQDGTAMLGGVADSESPGPALGVVAGAGEAGFPLSSSRKRGAMQACNVAIATGKRGTNDSAADFTTGTGFAVHPQLLLLCFLLLNGAVSSWMWQG